MTLQSPQLGPFPVLETERLILRDLRIEDAKDAFIFLSDREAMRFYDPPMSRLEQVETSIQRHRIRFMNHEAIRWGITLKEEGSVIGNCGYFWGTDTTFATLSYILAKSYWKRGIMTEALEVIVRFGFESVQFHRFEAYVAHPNRASASVLQKLGFQEEGLLRERTLIDGQFFDEMVYGLLHKSTRS